MQNRAMIAFIKVSVSPRGILATSFRGSLAGIIYIDIYAVS